MQPLIPYFEPVEIPITDTISVHGFGILVAIGFIAGAWMATKKAVRDGLEPDIINRWVTWLIAGVFVGGHLGHALFYEPAEHFADPIKFLKVWEGLDISRKYGCSKVRINVIVWSCLHWLGTTDNEPSRAVPLPHLPACDGHHHLADA